MMNNNLISLLDLTFPGINKLFTSSSRESDGHEKWVDFVLDFSHCDMTSRLTIKAFARKYRKWCRNNSYHFTESSCEKIYAFAKECVSSVSSDESIVFPVVQAAKMLVSATENCHAIQTEMNRVASQLPEYDTVMNIYSVGKAVGPQLMAEIGDPRRFHSRKAITAYFGYDSENNDSGQKTIKSDDEERFRSSPAHFIHHYEGTANDTSGEFITLLEILAYAFLFYYIKNFLFMPIIEVKPGFVCSEMSKYYDKGNFFLLIFILSFYIPLVNIFVTNGRFLS